MSDRSEWQAYIETALNSYQAQALYIIAAAHNIDRTRYTRKSDVVVELGRILVAGEGVAKRMAALTEPQVAALHFVAGRSTTTPLTSVQTLLRRHDLAQNQVDKQLRELLTAGLLLFHGNGQSWKLDLSGHDPTLSMRQVMAPPSVAAALPALPPWGSLVAPAEEPTRVLTGDPGTILRDIFLLLRSVRMRPVRLTKQNGLHQADLKRLANELRPHMTGVAWKEAASELSFVLDLSFATNLLDVGEQGVTAASAAESFLSASRVKQVEHLLAAWLVVQWSELERVPTLLIDQYQAPYGDAPTGEQLAPSRGLILSAVRALAHREWWDVSSLGMAIRRRDPEFVIGNMSSTAGYLYGYWTYGSPRPSEGDTYRGIRRAGVTDYRQSILKKDEDWDLVEGAFLRQVMLEPLRWLGVVDVGVADDERVRAVRVSALGREVLAGEASVAAAPKSGARLVVQPNFEIIVLDAAASLGLMTRLDEFATARSVDRAAIYQLNREALVSALQRGNSLSAIERLLETEGGTALPQNVQFTLAEWTRQFERVTVRSSVTILEADTAAQLDGWLADPTLAPHLERRLSPTSVIVRASGVAAVDARLKRLAGWRSETAVAPPPGSAVIRDDATLVVQGSLLGRFERTRLTSIAEPDESGARVTGFRLTRESLARACGQGWTAAQVLALINRRLGQTPPADLALKVRGWMDDLGPARQATVRLVRLPDPGLTRVVEQALAGGLVGRVGPGLIIVEEAALGAVGEAMAAFGVRVEAGLPATIAAGSLMAQETGGTTAGDLQTLRGRALRDFLEQAASRKQAVIIQHQGANQRSPKRHVVKPKYVDRRMAGHYLVATIETGADRAFKVDDIFGVVLEEDR